MNKSSGVSLATVTASSNLALCLMRMGAHLIALIPQLRLLAPVESVDEFSRAIMAKIVKKCGGRLIKARQQMLGDINRIDVRVPPITVRAIPMHGDEADACFHQPTGHQCRLAEQMAAIPIAERVRFLADIQRGPRVR